MNTFNKGFIPLGILLAILVITAIGGGFAIYHYRANLQPAVSMTQNSSDQNNNQGTTVDQNTSVTITNINPASGSVGTLITVTGTGFASSNNDVHIDRGGVPGVTSSNGTTLSLMFPRAVSTCDFVSDNRCMGATKLITPGVYPITITNANGISNAVSFTVTGLSNTSNGTLAGKATIASDCNIANCRQMNLLLLPILVRQGTTTVQTITFAADGSYSVSLAPGIYYLYEGNNNWAGTNLTTSSAGTRVNISAGATTTLNIVIENIKSGLPQ